MTPSADQPNLEPQPDSLSEEAARNALALNPLVGLRGKDLVDSAGILLKAMVNEPIVASSSGWDFSANSGKSARINPIAPNQLATSASPMRRGRIARRTASSFRAILRGAMP